MTGRRILFMLIGLMVIFGGFIPITTNRIQTPPSTSRSVDRVESPESVTGFFNPENAFARRGGGFGRSRSSGSLWNRRSSVRRSTPAKKATTPRRTTTPKRVQPSTTPKRSPRPAVKRSAMATRVSKDASKKSLDTHKSRQSQFSRTSTPAANTSEYKGNPIYNRGSQNRVPYNRYYDQRDRYYAGYGWRPSPFVYMSYPSFGMWDALIWWSILDNMHDRSRYSMAHHHANDPGYKEWRGEAERLAGDNAELRQKLDELDSKVSTLEGTPVNTDYLPPGVDPSVALAAEVAATADPGRPQLIVGTGIPSGNYHKFGTILRSKLPDFDTTLQTSNGSVENLENLISNQVDAILVQSDVLNAYLRQNPSAGEQMLGLQSTLYSEFVQLLVNEDSGIEGISELDPKVHTVYVGPRGSGTHGAWHGFMIQDPRYSEFNIRHASYEEALNQVVGNKDAVMLFVGGLNSDLLKQADTRLADKVNLVAVDAPQFSTAVDQFENTIYTVATIPDETYPNIQDGWIFGFGDSSVETLKVEAVLILSLRWIDTYGSRPMTVFEDAIWRSIEEIEPIVGEN